MVKSRRFSLFDGMVMIAATAVGFQGSLVCLGGPHLAVQAFISADPLSNILSAAPCLLAWQFALLVIGLRHRRQARQFGSAANLVAVGWCVIEFSRWMRVVLKLNQFDIASLPHVLSNIQYGLGPSTAAVWLALAIGGRWRCRTDWVETAGRLIGMWWIIFFVEEEFRRY